MCGQLARPQRFCCAQEQKPRDAADMAAAENARGRRRVQDELNRRRNDPRSWATNRLKDFDRVLALLGQRRKAIKR